jgi:hypothetical protein
MLVNPKHQPIPFHRYQEIHLTYIEKVVARSFIQKNTLEFRPLLGVINLSGEIACLGNILITVEKSLICEGYGSATTVYTDIYNYNACVRGYGNIFRHDNSHAREGHPDNHHIHEFDWRKNEQGEGKVTWVGEDSWLTLGEFIEKVEKWYWSHKGELPCPDSYPTLDLR